jgi:hypothetical protein
LSLEKPVLKDTPFSHLGTYSLSFLRILPMTARLLSQRCIRDDADLSFPDAGEGPCNEESRILVGIFTDNGPFVDPEVVRISQSNIYERWRIRHRRTFISQYLVVTPAFASSIVSRRSRSLTHVKLFPSYISSAEHMLISTFSYSPPT